MTSVRPEPDINTQEFSYDKAHGRTRNTIEGCIGCCLKDRVLHYSPPIASKTINSYVVLDDTCIDYQIPEPPEPWRHSGFWHWYSSSCRFERKYRTSLHLHKINPQLAEIITAISAQTTASWKPDSQRC